MEERIPLVTITRQDSLLLRGVAILLVLLVHTEWVPGEGCMVLFLLLSGYGLEESFRKNGFTLYWNRRIRRVWLPYVPVAILAIIMRRVSYTGGIVCTILGLDFNRLADTTMWYISYIMAWYLVYYCIALLTSRIRREPISVLVKLAGLLAAGLLFRWLYNTGVVWHENSAADNYIYAFPLGVALNEVSRVQVRSAQRDAMWTVLMFLCLAYLLRNYPKSYSAEMSMVMGFFPVAVVECIPGRGKLAGWLCWFGKYSYPIYLFEGLVLGKRNAWFAMLGAQPLIDLTFMAVSAALAFLYWEGIWKNIEKALPLDRLIRV